MARRPVVHPTPAPVPPFTVDEAAELGRVDRRTVHRWIAEQRFRSARPVAAGSGRRLIDRESYLAFLGIGGEPRGAA